MEAADPDLIHEHFREREFHLKDEWWHEGLPLFLDADGVMDVLDILSIAVSNAAALEGAGATGRGADRAIALADRARSLRAEILSDLRIKESTS